MSLLLEERMKQIGLHTWQLDWSMMTPHIKHVQKWNIRDRDTSSRHHQGQDLHVSSRGCRVGAALHGIGCYLSAAVDVRLVKVLPKGSSLWSDKRRNVYFSGAYIFFRLRGCILTESITKYAVTTMNTRWGATQRVMAAKLTRLIHKIAIQLHLVADSCTIFSSRSRRLVRKLLDTPMYSLQFYINNYTSVNLLQKQTVFTYV
jgi:hypothetical protein